MYKRTLGIALLAGLAFSGASAFTAGNTMSAVDSGTENVAGYGAATVSGATVLAIDYTQDAANSSLVDEVKFVAQGDITSKDGSVRLLNGTSVLDDATCTAAASTATTIGGISVATGNTVFTCSTPDVAIADISSIGITVNN